MVWNLHFPTLIERLLWRLSCLGILVIPTCWLILGSFCMLIFVVLFGIALRAGQKTPQDSYILMFVGPILAVGSSCTLLASMACGIFIAVESFISLRSFSEGAFRTVS